MSDAEFYTYRKVSLEGDKQIPFKSISKSLFNFWTDHFKKQPKPVQNYYAELNRRNNTAKALVY